MSVRTLECATPKKGDGNGKPRGLSELAAKLEKPQSSVMQAAAASEQVPKKVKPMTPQVAPMPGMAPIGAKKLDDPLVASKAGTMPDLPKDLARHATPEELNAKRSETMAQAAERVITMPKGKPAAKKTTERRKAGGVGATATAAILAGKSNQEALDAVMKAHPECSSNVGCMSWYRNKLRKQGLLKDQATKTSAKAPAAKVATSTARRPTKAAKARRKS